MNVQKLFAINSIVAISLMASVGLPHARTLDCISAGYCTNALECHTDGAGEKLVVRLQKGNTASFGWDGTDVRFTAKGIRKDGFTVYASATQTATQTFILADDMSASMGVTTYVLDQFYNSFHALTCLKGSK